MAFDIDRAATCCTLDCREKKNRIEVQKVLRTIPPLANHAPGTAIPIDQIEKVINILTKKYCIDIQWINHIQDVKKGVMYWSTSIRTTHTYKFLGFVVGKDMYETMAKVAIYMYACVKGMKYQDHDGIIPERIVWEHKKGTAE